MTRPARVWIDLSNSPHPLLFGPVARRLEDADHVVLITARDNAQTVELARERWSDVTVVGRPSPPARRAKAAAVLARARELAAWAADRRLDVALSHNSYAQIVAARRAHVPVLTAMDYEHQPVNHLAFRLAHLVLLPEAMRSVPLRRQGVTPRKTRFYEGLKEEVYLGDFQPADDILERLGVERSPERPLVVARTPPRGATYHQEDNPLFARLLTAIAEHSAARCVVLARTQPQRDAASALGLPNCTILTHAVDSRSLIRAADLMIGAGGTMTREAALMGIPTVSIFAGRQPAVDRWLEERGMLVRISDPQQLLPIRPRPREPVPLAGVRERSERLADVFAEAAVSLVGTGRASPGAAPGRAA